MREGSATTAAAVAMTMLVTATGACRDDGGDDEPDERPVVAELPATPNRDLDLLFVMDDTVSMVEVQNDLKVNLPRFVDRLRAVPGGLPNLHIGVISTDMGTKASGSATPAPAIGQLGQGGCAGTGKGGALQVGQVGANLTGQFLIDVDQSGGRMRNYTGELPNVLANMISLGAGGCGFEQPLAAMRAALDRPPANTGFLRDSAMLGVVLVTDEDDCSVASTQLFGPSSASLGELSSFRCTRFGVTCVGGGQTADEMAQVGAKDRCAANEASDLVDGVAAYRDFLLGLKPDPRRVIFGGIVGPAAPFAVELRAPPGAGAPVPQLAHVCSYQPPGSSPQAADPAPRLAAFGAGFGARGELTSICNAGYADNVTRLGDLVRRSMGSACVEAVLADADPKAPGSQPDCVVEDVAAGGAQAAAILPCESAAGALPCWRLEEDPVGCPLSPAPNLALRIDRDASPEPSVITQMRCSVAR
jgi:hypothetical protein